jgi:type II secretory pathway pseudopilin PulG
MIRSKFIRRPQAQSKQQGYILLTLLLLVALMVIAAAAVLPTITFENKRDQEEEMIHRGVQYTRAIRSYYKKLGRYPSKIEDLENTNNIRYLRKRYKDPLSCVKGKCQDFKLLHYGEAQLALGGLGGAGIAGATPAGAMNGPGGLNGGSGGFSTSGAGNGGLNSSSSSFSNSFSSNQAGGANQNAAGQSGDNANGTDATDPSQAGQAGQTSGNGSNTSSGDKLSSQVFGGAPIVGVASLSKKEGVREFNHKKKYNEWQFVYDPTMDRGGLPMTPNQPSLAGFANQNLNNGQTPNGTTGQSSPFGQSPLGQSPGMSNNPGFNNQNGLGNSNPPASPQQPQQ